jgi:hypothetical protein
MLQGADAFSPNSTLFLSYNPIDPSKAMIALTYANPAISDCSVFGSLDPWLIVQRNLTIELTTGGDAGLTGTYELTADSSAVWMGDGGRVATLVIYEDGGPYLGLIVGTIVATANSGTVVLQAMGSETYPTGVSGSFSASMNDGDGGQSQLSGTFETALVCSPP